MLVQTHKLLSRTCNDVAVKVMGVTSLATSMATGASNNPSHRQSHLSSNISKWANSVNSSLSRVTSSRDTELEAL